MLRQYCQLVIACNDRDNNIVHKSSKIDLLEYNLNRRKKNLITKTVYIMVLYLILLLHYYGKTINTIILL